MIKEVVRPVEGFEAIFAELENKRVNLEAEKEIAKAEALRKVDNDFAGISERIEKALKELSVVEEVEVEDEVVEEGEVVEGETTEEGMGIAE